MAKAIELPDGALLLLETHCSIPAADASKEIPMERVKHILQ